LKTLVMKRGLVKIWNTCHMLEIQRERERDKESECGSELTILHDCEGNVSRCKCLTLSSGFLLMQEFQ